MKNKGLGKGLSALLGSGAENVTNNEMTPNPIASDAIHEIDIKLLTPGNSQPRVYFDEVALQELAESIKRHGIIQPIIVQKQKKGKYEIIAGERRYRAAILASLNTVPAIVKGHDLEHELELALIENIQRENLDVVEEAEGYLRLMNEYNYTQEEVAKLIGKSRSHVANLLRITSLPSKIKTKLRNGEISMGHAKIIVGHPAIDEIVEIICSKNLNVRQTESLAKKWGKAKINSSNTEILTPESQDDLTNLVNMLSEKFDMKIAIEKGTQGGKIIFQFDTLEQLDDILAKLA